MHNFNHLYYFYVTAKSGGVNAAAKHLLISQPSLSSQLRVLEQHLNVRLFQKVGRKNQLSPEGKVIYGLCRQMFEISEELDELIAKKVPSASRKIHIGVSDEVDRPFVVEVVSLFLKKHGLTQRPKVTVVSGSHEQLTEQLRFRELDAVVTQLAMIDVDLENLLRAEVPVALACSSSWKIPSPKRNLSLIETLRAIEEVHDGHWLMPSARYKLRGEIDQFFGHHELRGRIVFESDVIASLVRSVADGIGMAFIPMLYVAREIREKSVRVIGPKEGYWKYQVWLACHTQNKDDALIKALSQSFSEICAQASGKAEAKKFNYMP
jgi:LysR family transcriptional regulator, transcriptional activator of nhaA